MNILLSTWAYVSIYYISHIILVHTINWTNTNMANNYKWSGAEGRSSTARNNLCAALLENLVYVPFQVNHDLFLGPLCNKAD